MQIRSSELKVNERLNVLWLKLDDKLNDQNQQDGFSEVGHPAIESEAAEFNVLRDELNAISQKQNDAEKIAHINERLYIAPVHGIKYPVDGSISYTKALSPEENPQKCYKMEGDEPAKGIAPPASWQLVTYVFGE